jgi:LPXTG-motif cell wall-anchored protein
MATQANAITDEGSKTNTAGQYVFIGVCAVLVGGAASLFFKYRKKSSNA